MIRKTDVLVVGGSVAGVTTAITARRHYPDSKITVLRREKQVSIPCGIPYIFGTLGSPEKNLLPDTALSKNNVELIIDEATSMDKDNKIVTTANGDTISYEKLVLTTGSVPFVPPIPGVELEGVFPVKKDIDHLNRLLKAVDKAKDLVVIGGGFIGVEFADECRKREGLNVTIIELLPHCLLIACDEESCTPVEAKLRENGVQVLTGSKAQAIMGNGKVEYVELADGEKLKADIVITGIGVKPNTELAQNAGLEVDERLGICVDECMRTSDPNIFAAGDCTQKKNFFTGDPSGLMLASIASIESRVAGANLFTLQRRNEHPIGIFFTVVGDLAIGSAGMTEKAAQEAGFDVATGSVSGPDRYPCGMPGMINMSVKLIFSKENGAIIGGHICGGSSVRESVNIIGAAIRKRMTAPDIVRLLL